MKMPKNEIGDRVLALLSLPGKQDIMESKS